MKQQNSEESLNLIEIQLQLQMLLVDGGGKSSENERIIHCLDIHLKEGKDLLVKDRCGWLEVIVGFNLIILYYIQLFYASQLFVT